MVQQILAILNSNLTPEQKAKQIALIILAAYPNYKVDMNELTQCISSGGFCIPVGAMAEKVCFIYRDPPGCWEKASGQDCIDYLEPWKKES